MTAHKVMSDTGAEFEVVIGADQRIVDVVGAWPNDDSEFGIEGPLPEHGPAAGAPDHIRAKAEAKGLDVCFYDPVHCRTCYCDGKGGMRCVSHC